MFGMNVVCLPTLQAGAARRQPPDAAAGRREAAATAAAAGCGRRRRERRHLQEQHHGRRRRRAGLVRRRRRRGRAAAVRPTASVLSNPISVPFLLTAAKKSSLVCAADVPIDAEAIWRRSDAGHPCLGRVWALEGVAITTRDSMVPDLAPDLERPGFSNVGGGGTAPHRKRGGGGRK